MTRARTFRWLAVSQILLWAIACVVWYYLDTSAYLAHPTDGDLYAHTWGFQALNFTVSRLPLALLSLGALLGLEYFLLRVPVLENEDL